MQAPLQQVAPGRLVVRDGGGCLGLFGLPFFCAGVGLLLVGFGVIPVAHGGVTPWVARPLTFFLGIAFTAVGGVLSFGRSWTTFNAGDRTVVVQYGLLVPLHTTTHAIGEYSAIILDFQRGDSDTADQFPVTLKARTGRDLKLFSPTEYAIATQRAAAVASLFNLEIEDRTTDHAVRIAPGQTELPLQHRARLDHQRDDIVARPGEMTSDVSDQQGTLRIVIPKRRVHAAMFLFYAVPVAVPFLIFQPFLQFFRQTRTPDIVSWIFLGVRAGNRVLPLSSASPRFFGPLGAHRDGRARAFNRRATDTTNADGRVSAAADILVIDFRHDRPTLLRRTHAD